MLLFREVCAWLRYSLARDPQCAICKIVAEEVPSTLLPYNDSTDGVRTLAIYRADVGLTPRIELRFTGAHPQIKWIASADQEPDGEYLQITNPMGFPGDGASWDVSDTVEVLMELAREKFCQSQMQITVVKAAAVEPGTKNTMDPQVVLRIVENASRDIRNGKHITEKMVTDTLKKEGGDITKFAWTVLDQFAKNKIKWDDVKRLAEKEILPPPWLKRNLDDDKYRGKYPPDGLDEISAATIKLHVDSIVEACTDGQSLREIRNPLLSPVRFGHTILSAFNRGTLPINYLEVLERCDPRETLAPWSWISRNVIAHEMSTTSEDLPTVILSWLEESNLLMPLYRGRDVERNGLKLAVAAHINNHIKNTLSNKLWTKAVVAGLSGNDLDRRRALQCEFDMWLIDALSPSVAPHKIPLSAYAFSSERKDQKSYADMLSAFNKCLAEWSKSYRQESLANLTNSLKNFYTEVVAEWDRPALQDYKPRVPSVGKIVEAAKDGNRDELLNLLVADLEAEVGSSVPIEVRAKLETSPFFNSVFTEVRVQSVKF
jgi:hypothetical protein